MNNTPEYAATWDNRDAELRPWVYRATVLIAARVADARAHAEAGRTLDASSRLAELRKALADDTPGAPSLLADARGAFYRSAFAAEPFDESVMRDVRPDDEGDLAARYAVIAGTNQYVAFRLLFEQLDQSLRALSDASLHAPSVPSNAPHDGPWRSMFSGWERRTVEQLQMRMNGSLSDAQMALSEAVSRVRIKPELL